MVSINSKSPIVLNNLISIKVAASYCSYSLQYIRRLLRFGQLSGWKVGQLWLIGKEIFDLYLENAIKVKGGRFEPKEQF